MINHLWNLHPLSISITYLKIGAQSAASPHVWSYSKSPMWGRVKRQVLDLTNGPAVGISTLAVLYLLAAEVLICRYNYYSRVILAAGDSTINEVWRVQNSIGDAICDRGALIWEHFPKYADLSDKDLSTWSVKKHLYWMGTDGEECLCSMRGYQCSWGWYF